MKEKILLTIWVCCSFIRLTAQDIVIGEQSGPGFFPVVSVSSPTTIYVDESDHWLMQRAAILLQQDIEMLTGRKAEIIFRLPQSADHLIIIGSLDHSPLIKNWLRKNSYRRISRSMGEISTGDHR
jgi:hypothetical protein